MVTQARTRVLRRCPRQTQIDYHVSSAFHVLSHHMDHKKKRGFKFKLSTRCSLAVTRNCMAEAGGGQRQCPGKDQVLPWMRTGGGIASAGENNECMYLIVSEAERFESQQHLFWFVKLHISACHPLWPTPTLQIQNGLFYASLHRREQAALARGDALEAGRVAACDPLPSVTQRC